MTATLCLPQTSLHKQNKKADEKQVRKTIA